MVNWKPTKLKIILAVLVLFLIALFYLFLFLGYGNEIVDFPWFLIIYSIYGFIAAGLFYVIFSLFQKKEITKIKLPDKSPELDKSLKIARVLLCIGFTLVPLSLLLFRVIFSIIPMFGWFSALAVLPILIFLGVLLLKEGIFQKILKVVFLTIFTLLFVLFLLTLLILILPSDNPPGRLIRINFLIFFIYPGVPLLITLVGIFIATIKYKKETAPLNLKVIYTISCLTYYLVYVLTAFSLAVLDSF